MEDGESADGKSEVAPLEDDKFWEEDNKQVQSRCNYMSMDMGSWNIHNLKDKDRLHSRNKKYSAAEQA